MRRESFGFIQVHVLFLLSVPTPPFTAKPSLPLLMYGISLPQPFITSSQEEMQRQWANGNVAARGGRGWWTKPQFHPKVIVFVPCASCNLTALSNEEWQSHNIRQKQSATENGKRWWVDGNIPSSVLCEEVDPCVVRLPFSLGDKHQEKRVVTGPYCHSAEV